MPVGAGWALFVPDDKLISPAFRPPVFRRSVRFRAMRLRASNGLTQPVGIDWHDSAPSFDALQLQQGRGMRPALCVSEGSVSTADRTGAMRHDCGRLTHRPRESCVKGADRATEDRHFRSTGVRAGAKSTQRTALDRPMATRLHPNTSIAPYQGGEMNFCSQGSTRSPASTGGHL